MRSGSNRAEAIRPFTPWAYALSVLFLVVWGCQSQQPEHPVRAASLNVQVPFAGTVNASLLGAAQNEVIYRVDAPGHVLVAENKVGPFSTTLDYGSANFTVDIPAQDNLLLSLQLNDASTHVPLAVGAVPLNLLSSPVSNIVVNLGSVSRNCYTLQVPTFAFQTYTYGFSSDNLFTNQVTGTGWDFYENYVFLGSAPLTFTDATGVGVPLPTIAYLGNGNLVDFDYLPLTAAYKTTSALAKGAPVSAGDIFSLKLGSITNGYAWMQVVTPGNGAVSIAPKFRFRVNSTKPYFAYEQTSPDSTASCNSGW